jgi:hypothetical protein
MDIELTGQLTGHKKLLTPTLSVEITIYHHETLEVGNNRLWNKKNLVGSVSLFVVIYLTICSILMRLPSDFRYFTQPH